MPDPDNPFNAKLVEKQLFHETLGIFRVMYDQGQVPDFEPGQFTNLALLPPVDPDAPVEEPAADEGVRRKRRGPKLVRRAYSIASAPSEKRFIEFYIVAVDEGALTPRVFDLEVGDPVFMDTKIKGHFTLKGVPDGKDLVTVATGTGLAPFLSMYQQYKNTDRFNRFVFIHGVRYEEDLGYRQQLEQIAASDPRVAYLPAVTRAPEDSNWQGIRGRVTTIFNDGTYAKLTGTDLNPEQSHIFLCGNPAMIDQLEGELVADHGFVVKTPRQKDGNLHFERYW